VDTRTRAQPISTLLLRSDARLLGQALWRANTGKLPVFTVFVGLLALVLCCRWDM
jgi:hypothetical protein